MVDLFLKRKIKTLKSRHRRSKRFMNYADVQRISVLFDPADYEHLLPFVDELLADGKQVMVWGYAAQGIQDRAYPYYYNLITDRELNFFYLPKKATMNRFLGYSADLMIDLCYRPNALTEYLLACSPALYRLGFRTEDAVWYDMIIDIRGKEKEEMEKNAANMLFYLKNLRVK